jgi:hypothetical protein
VLGPERRHLARHRGDRRGCEGGEVLSSGSSASLTPGWIAEYCIRLHVFKVSSLSLGALPRTSLGAFAPPDPLRFSCVIFSDRLLHLWRLSPPALVSGFPPSREEGTPLGFHARRASLAPAACDRRVDRCSRFRTAVRWGAAVHGRKPWPSSKSPTWGSHSRIRKILFLPSGRCPEPPLGAFAPPDPLRFCGHFLEKEQQQPLSFC